MTKVTPELHDTKIATSKYFSRPRAAEYLDVSVSWLAKQAMTDRSNPPMLQFGRSVKYSQDALDRWAGAQGAGGNGEAA